MERGLLPDYGKTFEMMYSRKATWNGDQGYAWFLKSNWPERARQLFAAAAEAAK
jgi:hypothetical protein